MRNRPEPRARGGVDGFVLIAVLSVMALLSGLVLAMLLLSRNSVETAALSGTDVATDALVQSGISLVGYQLFVLKLPAAQLNGQQIRLDQGVVTIAISSDAGKVDLNGSGKELLVAAYEASGLQTMRPADFAARVMDWRDPDDDLAAGGAEAAEYGAAGLTYGPRNGPFRSVDDLRWVVGVAAADMRVLADVVTIYNPAGRLDVFTTPQALLAALPGVTREVSDQVLSARRTRTDAAAAKLADLLLVQSAFITTDPPSVVRIRLEARLNGQDKPRRFDIVMTAGTTPMVPYHILEWSQ